MRTATQILRSINSSNQVPCCPNTATNSTENPELLREGKTKNKTKIQTFLAGLQEPNSSRVEKQLIDINYRFTRGY